MVSTILATSKWNSSYFIPTNSRRIIINLVFSIMATSTTSWDNIWISSTNISGSNFISSTRINNWVNNSINWKFMVLTIATTNKTLDWDNFNNKWRRTIMAIMANINRRIYIRFIYNSSTNHISQATKLELANTNNRNININKPTTSSTSTFIK